MERRHRQCRRVEPDEDAVAEPVDHVARDPAAHVGCALAPAPARDVRDEQGVEEERSRNGAEDEDEGSGFHGQQDRRNRSSRQFIIRVQIDKILFMISSLQRLEGFYWVARIGGYARAARAFPYPITQPGVHQQVRRL